MNVKVNGELHSLPDGLTVRGLIERMGLVEGPVAVEVNQAVVPRAEHAARALSDGDLVEIVHFVGGG